MIVYNLLEELEENLPNAEEVYIAVALAKQNAIEDNYETYRRRQAIVEHPYGVIKRQWDFYYVMSKKTIKDATADVGLIFTAYNLKRIFNLLDINELKKYLKSTSLFY